MTSLAWTQTAFNPTDKIISIKCSFFPYLITEANPENTGLVKPWKICLLKIKIKSMAAQNKAVKSLQIFLSENLWFGNRFFWWSKMLAITSKGLAGQIWPAEVHSARPDGSWKSLRSLLHSRHLFMRVMSFSIIKPSPFCTKLLCVLKCNLAGGELGIFSDQGRLKRTDNW